MQIANKTILVTGANRGLGLALVEDALRRGAQRVYAASRKPLTHSDPRVLPVTLDVTNIEQIQAAAQQIKALDLLVNNVAKPRNRRARAATLVATTLIKDPWHCMNLTGEMK